MDQEPEPGETPPEVRVDLDDLASGSADPEAITEQPDLHFEHQAEAKWIGDVFGLRLLAVALTAAKRKRRGEHVSPIPWIAIAATSAVVIGAVLLVALVVKLVP